MPYQTPRQLTVNKADSTLRDVIRSRKKITDKGVILITRKGKEEYLSYSALYENALLLKNRFERSGVASGDQLIFQLTDSRLFVIAFWACILGNIVPVPVTFGYSRENFKKIVSIWNKLTVPKLIFEQSLYKKLSKEDTFGIENFLKNTKHDILTLDGSLNVEGNCLNRGKEKNFENTAYIQFSSGSTGDPKGIVLTNGNVIANVNAIIDCAEIKRNSHEKTLSWMPLTHDMGLIGFHLVPLFAKIDQYIMSPRLFIRDPNVWLYNLSKYKITYTSSPNFGYKYLIDRLNSKKNEKTDLSTIKLIFNGGEPISAGLVRTFNEKMSRWKLNANTMFPVYGLAEASLAVAFPEPGRPTKTMKLSRYALNPGQKAKTEAQEGRYAEVVATGRAVAGCRIRIRHSDETMDVCNIGHIEIKGANVTSGYYNDAVNNREYITDDGWLRTGDIGVIIDSDLYVTGRSKDILILRGQNYYPADLENIVHNAGISEKLECAIAGVTDTAKETPNVICFFKSKKSKEYNEMSMGIAERLYREAGIRIDQVAAVQTIPKTTSGKIKRYLLIEWLLKGKCLWHRHLEKPGLEDDLKATSEGDHQRLTQTEHKICEIFFRVFNNKNVQVDEDLATLGLDSMGILKILDDIEAKFPGKIQISDFFRFRTIRELSKQIDKNIHRPNTLFIGYMSFPPHFFMGNGGMGSSRHLKVGIPDKVVRIFKKMIVDRDVSFRDHFPIILLVALRRITTDNVVSFQTVLNDDEILVIHRFVLQPIKDLMEIFSGIRSKQIREYQINMIHFDQFKRVKFDTSPDQASVIMHYYNISQQYRQVMSEFDIRIGIADDNNGYHLYFDCNERKMGPGTVKELIASYVETMHDMIDTYQKLVCLTN